MKLYKIIHDPVHCSPYRDGQDEEEGGIDGKEWRSLSATWQPLSYTFESDWRVTARGWSIQRPDLCLYHDGLFVRRDLVDVIFPNKTAELEWLPVRIDDEDWCLLNCLKTTKDYDPEQSKLVRRGGNQHIEMVDYLVVRDDDASLAAVGLFTLEDSNRYSLFATETVVTRVNNLGLKGVGFDDIGVLVPQ